MELKQKLELGAVLGSANISPLLHEDDLDAIGHRVIEEFELDKASRQDWEKRNDDALRLAMQVVQKKTFPWPDASNVKFPLLTIAALQFHSRAYPALINGPLPVACRSLVAYPRLIPMPPNPAQLPGAQPQAGGAQAGQAQQDPKAQEQMQKIQMENKKLLDQWKEEKERARRVAEHMSYQILEEDEQWEDQQDRALLITSILGCAFKKTYFDPISGHNISECVSPRELVVSYYTKHIDTTPRASHIIYLSHNAMRERQIRGVFNEFDEDSPAPTTRFLSTDNEANDRQGTEPPAEDLDCPYELIEQHRWLDLDGDGYAEPYIVTVRLDTQEVLRVVARFTQADIEFHGDKIIRIEPISMFTKYGFIPSPDGGFYDLGFGALLGPINDVIDTAINQLLDAGSLSTAGGGFLGRGFKAKKGDLRFRVGEWKQVDCTGDDLKKSIFPLPIREPSTTLFNLLSLLIEYGQQVAGAADILQGKNPGQNTPAETSRTMVEQGMKVFNGIYKRIHRSFTQELRKCFRLNQVFLSDESTYYTPTAKASSKIFNADYSGKGSQIRPSADPFYMSDAQRLQTATAIREAAHTSPGYNLYLVERKFLEALKTNDIEELLPDPKGPNAIPPPPNPKVQIEQIKNEVKMAQLQLESKKFEFEQKVKQVELAEAAQKMQADISKIQAEIMKIMAEAQSLQGGQELDKAKLQVEQLKLEQQGKMAHLEGLMKAIEIMQRVTEGNQKLELAQIEQQTARIEAQHAASKSSTNSK